VQQIRLILKSAKTPEAIITDLDNVIAIASRKYLDVAVANFYWDYWHLDKAFTNSTASEMPTEMIARILTMNRCIEPRAHYSIPKWVKRTVLPEILEFDAEALNDDKIYYELDKIEENKKQIEQHLFDVTKKRKPESYKFAKYDLSTSYFVGYHCPLSVFGRSKDNEPYQRQVVLALLINDEGYPFKWDVFPGNQAEVKTLADNISACRNLGLDGITMVFDRGLVSKENLKMLQGQDKDGEIIGILEEERYGSDAPKAQLDLDEVIEAPEDNN